MRNNYLISILSMFFVISSLQLEGQIIITTDHMPDQGDTTRVSEANYPVTSIPDPSLTGFDYLWDYSSLEPVSQRVLNYINPNQTPFLYQLVFSPSVANLALPAEGFDFFDIQVTDAYEYYKNTSTEYVRAGYAASIMGLPVPMKYNVPERFFRFPLSVNSEPDSSNSELEIQYPSVAYFSLYRKRVNSVDGSGIVITPYGTYNTIRVKSVIYERDSLYIDSLQTGVPIERNIIEYKWLSPDFPVPVLTISAEGFAYTVQYVDSARNIIPLVVNLGDDITVCQGNTVILNAEVQGGHPPYTYLWSTMDTSQSLTVTAQETTTYTVTVFDSDGNFVFDEIEVIVIPFDRISLGNDTLLCAEHEMNFTIDGYFNEITWFINNVEKGSGPTFSVDSTGIGLNQATVRVEYRQDQCTASDEVAITFHICNGVYEFTTEKLIIVPNPASEVVVVQTDLPLVNPKICILDFTGKEQSNFSFQLLNGKIILNIENLKPGIYFLKVEEKNTIKAGKLIKI
jgi:hypothetical protein